MKNLYFLIVSILIFNFTFANPVITAVQNGSWSNKNTWDKSRTPSDDDIIVIPAGKTVSFDDGFLSVVTLNNVDIFVSGTLQLGGFLSSLSLDKFSTINILSGGILKKGGLWQNITIGGNEVFSSSSPNVSGPEMANATTNGFISFSPLPVKFESFTLSRTSNNVLVQWSVSQEVNVSMYEVERSVDGTSWSTIAYVAPVATASSVKNYSFTDKSLSAKTIYYRIKEVDFDAKTSYSSIQSIHTEVTTAASNIKIASLQNKVLLQFPTLVKGQVVIRFVSLSGQVLDQQTINNPLGQVMLNSKLTGNYIISVSNGQDINTAKQVIL